MESKKPTFCFFSVSAPSAPNAIVLTGDMKGARPRCGTKRGRLDPEDSQQPDATPFTNNVRSFAFMPVLA